MKRFFQKFSLDESVSPRPLSAEFPGNSSAVRFLSKYRGASFNRGLYRLHSGPLQEHWTKVVEAVFPDFEGQIYCFGCDWLGRQFAAKRSDESAILMFDIDTGKALEIPASFEDFHEIELVDYGNDALAERAFDDWIATQDSRLGNSECVGFKIPLHLGGKDEPSNRDRIDMEVYWAIGAQILDKLKPLEHGQRIAALNLTTDNTE